MNKSKIKFKYTKDYIILEDKYGSIKQERNVPEGIILESLVNNTDKPIHVALLEFAVAQGKALPKLASKELKILEKFLIK